MTLYLANAPINCRHGKENPDLCRPRQAHMPGCMKPSSSGRESAAGVRTPHALSWACLVAGMLAVGGANHASAQSPAVAYADAPPAQPTEKPMSPARMTWMKGRCSQLVAFFDYYGVSRGENSDGARNHTQIGATLECERMHVRTGVKTMEALLKRKAFDIPKPGTPEVEPEDLEAPDITRPVSQRY